MLTAALSISGHLFLLQVVLNAQVTPPKAYEMQPLTVALVDMIEPPPPAVPIAPSAPAAEPTPPKPPPPRNIVKPRPKPVRPPPVVDPLPAREGAVSAAEGEVSDAQVASAARAGAGPPGAACNMLAWLQSALRKDRMVQSAAAQAHRGKAILVWNGDWVRHGDQEGAGLAAVREVILWEVAFAPEACRKERVHGLVLISLSDGPGAARLVAGTGDWRWSDLLSLRRPVLADR